MKELKTTIRFIFLSAFLCLFGVQTVAENMFDDSQHIEWSETPLDSEGEEEKTKESEADDKIIYVESKDDLYSRRISYSFGYLLYQSCIYIDKSTPPPEVLG